MKFIHKFILAALLFVGVSACDQTELDLLDNPNAVKPENADPDFLYNNIQLNFNTFHIGFWGANSGVTRMRAMQQPNYQGFITPGAGNGNWFRAYAVLFPDMNSLIKVAGERSLFIHSGSAKIMKAFVMMTLVDIFGDVPYEEAGKGVEAISPASESGKGIYDKAIALLDDAIAELSKAVASTKKPAVDIFYAGNAARWITLAKTLKMRAYVQTRLVDGSAGTKFKDILTAGDFIDAANKDFEFTYGSNRVNPNSRHPFYNEDYETANDGGYMNNYYMWLLAEAKGIEDPRLRFYFYRQVSSYDLTNTTLYSCIYSAFPDSTKTPDFYKAVHPKMPYCVGTYTGYYGRDHGNGQGIPPDGPMRAEYGIYPAGGRYDDNSLTFTQAAGTQGALGAGINPIMLATYVDFMRAEAALTMNTGENARAMLEKAVRSSIDKVVAFKSKADLSRVIGTNPATGAPILASALIPTAATITEYVNKVLADYDAAADDNGRLNVIVREYYLALWGNSLEAYNTFRRTCLPKGLQPNINNTNDPFPRSWVYPQDHIERNQNATQKANLTIPVFWDTNPAGCIQ